MSIRKLFVQQHLPLEHALFHSCAYLSNKFQYISFDRISDYSTAT